ncbi:hypothetical protein H5410_050222 [Solanum commersonii]|uniref:Uncharacterized protein n=1 Tax=Solanum commersonii TaxID=4109 RepID=A0A9J5WUS8_SOLCO|nr:hypothetical protein H5410_050222 [Solanum commersonii]
MAEIDNYDDSGAQSTDDVESNTGDEDDDPLSLPICAREISDNSYNLTTWMDELGSFPAKISVRARMALYRDVRKLLVQEKNYNDFKGTCFGHLRNIPEYFKFHG